MTVAGRQSSRALGHPWAAALLLMALPAFGLAAVIVLLLLRGATS